MTMTAEQLDNWFTYHAPTSETAPKYAAIRAAEQVAHSAIAGLSYRLGLTRDGISPETNHLTPDDCDIVNEACKAFAQTIDIHAPDSADKTAAIRCVRLARNAANEFIMSNVSGYPVHIDCAMEANRQLVLARWQANSAIACGGK